MPAIPQWRLCPQEENAAQRQKRVLAQVRVLQTLVCRPSREGWNSLTGDAVASNCVDAPSRSRPPHPADVSRAPRGILQTSFQGNKPLDEETENLHKVCACALAPAFRAVARQKSLHGQIPGAIGASSRAPRGILQTSFRGNGKRPLVEVCTCALAPVQFSLLHPTTRGKRATPRTAHPHIRCTASRARASTLPEGSRSHALQARDARGTFGSSLMAWGRGKCKKKKRSSMHLFQSPF